VLFSVSLAYGLSQGITNGPLTFPASSAVGGNGVYNYGNVFPSNSNLASNYYVDVVFAPAAPTSYVVLSFNPSNPSIPSNAPMGSVVATITPSWSEAARSMGRSHLRRPIPMLREFSRFPATI
jgi:hypothetical protein